MIRIREKKKYLKWIIFIAIVVPFPTKPFHSFKIGLIDESGRPIANASGIYNYCMYPSLKIREITINLDENGEAFLKGQNVWMNLLSRIGYCCLSLISRSGWSSTDSKLIVVIPHKRFQTKIRIAKLTTPIMDHEQFSFDPELRFGGVSYYRKDKGLLFFINTEVNDNGDLVKLTIIRSKDSIIANIRLKLFVLSPNIDNIGNLIEHK